ncbi:unnamed protein product [Mytilus coruscus]|uniref:DZIP3-like HEPN domain-containing protein n=1 Tax=Mytilus coruscus TaxID=42192 RepID=A0A6J8DQX1_MYTCO|nr:unnamed protein product [Mytilus coruscus]
MNKTVIAIDGIEEDRFIRTQKLMDVATDALRVKFDDWHPPKTLKETLRFYKKNIMKNINRKDQDKLYPESGPPITSAEMDLTLLVRVLRNTGIEKPYFGFDNKPLDSENNFGADVVRLNYLRNDLYHSNDRKLNEQQYESMSKTLKEVISRFSGSLFDDKIRCIMEGSLDTRAVSFTWHVHEAILLAPKACNKAVIQPIKASVIQLYDHQPLRYLIYGGTVLTYGMTNIQSLEELIYYLSVVQCVTVRQCIFILNEHPFLKEKLAQLILGQETSVGHGFMIVENVNISASNSTPISVLSGLHSQCGQVKQGFMPSSRPCAMDSSCTKGEVTEAPFRKRHFIKHYTKEHCRMVEQQHSMSYSNCITDSASAESTTKVECCNLSGSNIDKNLYFTCQTELQSEFPSSCQLSRSYTDGNQLMTNELEAALVLKCPEPHHSKNQVNSPLNTDFPKASQSDLNGNGCCGILESEVIEKTAPINSELSEGVSCVLHLANEPSIFFEASTFKAL